MKKLFVLILLAILGGTSSATPLGVFPQETQELCKNFHGLTMEMGFDASVEEKDLPCLQSQVAFLQNLINETYTEALAKANNKAKFAKEQQEWTKGMDPYDSVKDNPSELLQYRMELTDRVIDLAMSMVPKIKYPRKVVHECNTEPEGSPWADSCINAKSDYWTKGMQANLKKLIAASSDPAALEAEQKKWAESIEDFCTCDATSHINFSYYDKCQASVKIIRAAQIAEMAKQLDKSSK